MPFATAITPAAVGRWTLVSDYGAISTHSEREPDYSVWSHDEDWTGNLITAASEAMLASQA